jgi:hypothetical protein
VAEVTREEFIFGLLVSSNAGILITALVRGARRWFGGLRVREKDLVKGIIAERDDYKARWEAVSNLAEDYRIRLGWAHYELTSHGMKIPEEDPLAKSRRKPKKKGDD